MAVDIQVVVAILLHPFHVIQFRKHLAQKPRRLHGPEHRRGRRRRQEQEQLLVHPFARHPGKFRGGPADGRGGFRE